MISNSILVLATLLALPGQTGGPTAGTPNTGEDPVTAFRELVGEVAEKTSPTASDYAAIAQGTVALGQAAQQAGQPLPDPVIHDGLSAVEAGRGVNDLAANWGELERQLVELLEYEEPPQQQDQQDQQSSEDQQQEQDQDQQSGEQSGGQDSESQEGQNEQNQEGQQGESGQQNEQQGSESGNQPEGQQEQQPSNDPSETGLDQPSPMQDGAKLGDLQGDEEGPPPQLDEAPQSTEAPQEDMQVVGGQERQGEQRDARTAAILQKLERLKEQDEPAKLFRILQEAQSDDQDQQQPSNKDW